MNKFNFFLSLLIFSQAIYALEYRCTLNNAPPGKTIAREDVAKYVRKFEINPKAGAKGKSVDFQEHRVLIWNKNEMTQMVLKNKRTKQEASASFDPRQPSFHLSLSPSGEVKCVDKKLAIADKDKGINSVLNEKLTEGSPLRQFTNRIRFTTQNILKFVYNQKTVNGEMRPIIFQEGKTYTADDDLSRDKKGNFCVFQIQVKLDEDIYMPKGVKLDPLVFQVHSNNSSHDVFSYSFVDFAKGKKSYETYNYALFGLDCNIKKGDELTPALFNSITGSRFNLEIKK
jgi:hypothetical protein